MVSATNFAAGKETSGFLFGYFGDSEDIQLDPLADKFSLQASKKSDLALVKLAEASTAPVPDANNNFGNEDEMMLQGQSLVASTSPVRKDPKEDEGVTIYEVQQGDTVGSIAVKFHITVNTIRWANEIDNIDSIMPGDKIFILPVAGLTYVVKKSDNLDYIANKYKADKEKIIAFNDLPANGELKEGQEIVIPEGQKEIPAPSAPSGIASRPYEPFTPSGKNLNGKAGTGHIFPYGYCTWYVAQKKYVPWSGNAGTWLYKARAMGYATGRAPRVGSIMVSSESWWGHVAIVESISGGNITISEMNYKGWAKRSTRTLAASSRVIKGFIY